MGCNKRRDTAGRVGYGTGPSRYVDPRDHYAVLWLYLAQRRAGLDAAEQHLTQNAKKLDLTEWPGPVVDMFLEAKTAEQMFASYQSATGAERRQRDGEANLYVAQKLLLDKDQETAITYLRNAIELGEAPSNEYLAAKAELDRLGG
jgi:lipoprotein NlpI